MDQDAGQANKVSNKTSERQTHANRLVSSYRQEANVLLKEVLRAQNRWRNELQQELHVLAGVPNMKPYVRAQPHVRRRIEWKQSERDALKKKLLGLGLGRWKEIHAVLEKSLHGFRHGPGDVEDACWQLLGEVQLLLSAPDDRLYVARLMEPIADRGPVWTPGAGYTKLHASAKNIIRRLALLEDFNALMPALLRSEAVAGYFRSLVHAMLPAAASPAPWWDVECDVALMVGMHRHGFANYEAIRKDAYFEQAFQHKQRQLYHTQAADTCASSTNSCIDCQDRWQQPQPFSSPMRALLANRHTACIGELYWRLQQHEQL